MSDKVAVQVRLIDPVRGGEFYDAQRVLRWRVLRMPLGMGPGSEENAHEWTSDHWVAVAEGKVIGCVLLHAFDDGGLKVGKLMQMVIDTAWQGRGLGRALVGAVQARAEILGLQNVVLHARETAAGFYERCGYLPEGERFTEVGLPHIRMRRAVGVAH